MEQSMVKAETQVSIPRVTPEVIQETKQQISLLQNMVATLLQKGIDYGRIPGTPADSLWDPGASLIISAFNSYSGERRLLNFRDDGEMIAVCVEVPVISRKTGAVIGTGVGAASTRETKYKYRWVESPEEWGYDGDAVKTLKIKKEGEKTLYRIPNPEHGELLNTIFKMASKRGEVDAAESLPGVATALRKLFEKKPMSADKPDWKRYYGEIARLGFSEDEVRERLKVGSMKAWLDQGKTLEDALDTLRKGFKPPAAEGKVESTDSQGSDVAGDGFTIDLQWLKDSQENLKWTEETMLSFIQSTYKVSGKTVPKALNKLTRGQAEDFVDQINKRIKAIT